jgi:hypothetical protein
VFHFDLSSLLPLKLVALYCSIVTSVLAYDSRLELEERERARALQLVGTTRAFTTSPASVSVEYLLTAYCSHSDASIWSLMLTGSDKRRNVNASASVGYDLPLLYRLGVKLRNQG